MLIGVDVNDSLIAASFIIILDFALLLEILVGRS